MIKEELLQNPGRFIFSHSEVHPNESILTLSVGESVDFKYLCTRKTQNKREAK